MECAPKLTHTLLCSVTTPARPQAARFLPGSGNKLGVHDAALPPVSCHSRSISAAVHARALMLTRWKMQILLCRCRSKLELGDDRCARLPLLAVVMTQHQHMAAPTAASSSFQERDHQSFCRRILGFCCIRNTVRQVKLFRASQFTLSIPHNRSRSESQIDEYGSHTLPKAE